MNSSIRGYFTLLIYFLISICGTINAQKVRISGVVYDERNQETLPYANVYLQQGQFGVSATEGGYYSIEIAPDIPVKLCCSFVGMDDTCLNVLLQKDTIIDFYLKGENTLKEVDVISSKNSSMERISSLSSVEISKKTILDMPVILGEADVLKTIQMMPQATGGLEGSTDMFVRGADNGQNLIFIDGVPVYNLSHTYGLFSAIDPNAIVNLDFYPGVAPADFSGRLSSYLNIHLKEGNLKRFGGGLNIGLISSRVWLEGPIKKNKHSFFFSIRRSYLDLVFRALNSNSNNGLSNLTDGTAKIQFKLSETSKLFLSFYGSKDNLFGNETYGSSSDLNNENWGNNIINLRWLKKINTRLISNSNLFYTRYFFNINSQQNLASGGTNSFQYSNELKNFGVKQKFDFFYSEDHQFSFGFNFITQSSEQPSVQLTSLDSQGILLNDSMFSGDRRILPELSFFFQGNKSWQERWLLKYGIAFVKYFPTTATNLSLQPRIDLFYSLSNSITLHAGYDRDFQYLHQLRFSRLQLPSDLWIGASSTLLPGNSNQYILGGIYSIPYFEIDLKVEGYYKSMQNILERKEGENLLFVFGPPEEFVEQGSGAAYGIETSLEKKTGRLQGQVSYTWSRSNRLFQALNNGSSFPFDFERIHNIKIFGSYAFNSSFSISASWIFGSGFPYQIWTQRYPTAPGFESLGSENEVAYIGSKNSQRLNPFHRLNLNLKFEKKTAKNNQHIFLISVYNVYSRLNSYFLFYEPQANNTFNLKSTSYLPILPMLSYSYLF